MLIKLLTLLGISLASLEGADFLLTPPQNFTLSDDYIAVHHPVNTDQEKAQLYFDQGLTFVYAFNHEAAYWSFLKASEIDPNMSMAYWGQALVLGANININITPKREKMACELVQKAWQLAKNGPSNEKAYIGALKERYSQDPKVDKTKLSLRYSEAMKKVAHQYPDDLDATVLYAESLLNLRPWYQWSHTGKPKKWTSSILTSLESVLIRDPMHLGANHYYIHAIEASPFVQRGLMSAYRLKTLLPSSGHILHMPSHIYILVGDYEQAVRSNEQAIAVDREYIQQYGTDGVYPVHYMSHNYHFLSQAHAMQGNYEGAKRAAQDLLDLYLPHYSSMPELEIYASTVMFVNLRFHEWDELLNLPDVPENMLITQTMRHFGRAVAFVALGKMTEALEEQKMFLAGERMPASATYGNNPASTIFKIAKYYLEAKIADAQNQIDRAVDSFKKALAEQDQLDYDEPPNWLFSVRDQLGSVLLKKGRFSEAEHVFREDLRRRPRNGRSLFGLKKSLAEQARWSDYYWVNQAFEQAWRFSDITLDAYNL